MDKDHGPRILVFAIFLAIVGMIFAASVARADSFNDRFTTETPKSGVLNPPARDDEETLPAGECSIKLLLIIDGKVARSIPYNEETYPTGEACTNSVLADKPLQASMQTAANAAVKGFGETAKLAIVCTMQLD